MAGKFKPKVGAHRGYDIVTEISSFWTSSTYGFNPYFSIDEAEMSKPDLVRLITTPKRMRVKCRSAIDELEKLRE